MGNTSLEESGRGSNCGRARIVDGRMELVERVGARIGRVDAYDVSIADLLRFEVGGDRGRAS